MTVNPYGGTLTVGLVIRLPRADWPAATDTLFGE